VDFEMAHAAANPSTTEALADHVTPAAVTAVQHPPVTPGKVAMWLFLATEIMFFTGLIGSYIVLRAGSPATAYSNLYSPATDLTMLEDKQGVLISSTGSSPDRIAEILHKEAGLTEEQAHERLHQVPHAIIAGLFPDQADRLLAELKSAGAEAKVEELEKFKWPLPYNDLTNPLSIDLTAANTFILICSSVTMVWALAAIQRGDKRKLSLFLLATVLIGGTFLGVQVYEYYQLMFGHHYPPGISASGHFRPSVSLFASCFFTMTGFHGAHVAAGVITISIIFLQSLRGAYSQNHHSPVELVGLYWHFVDLVWIILFTVVYLL
jgi:heme/copper-type cytochrome/quinol oxidase subunit 3